MGSDSKHAVNHVCVAIGFYDKWNCLFDRCAKCNVFINFKCNVSKTGTGNLNLIVSGVQSYERRQYMAKVCAYCYVGDIYNDDWQI